MPKKDEQAVKAAKNTSEYRSAYAKYTSRIEEMTDANGGIPPSPQAREPMLAALGTLLRSLVQPAPATRATRATRASHQPMSVVAEPSPTPAPVPATPTPSSTKESPMPQDFTQQMNAALSQLDGAIDKKAHDLAQELRGAQAGLASAHEAGLALAGDHAAKRADGHRQQAAIIHYELARGGSPIPRPPWPADPARVLAPALAAYETAAHHLNRAVQQVQRRVIGLQLHYDPYEVIAATKAELESIAVMGEPSAIRSPKQAAEALMRATDAGDHYARAAIAHGTAAMILLGIRGAAERLGRLRLERGPDREIAADEAALNAVVAEGWGRATALVGVATGSRRLDSIDEALSLTGPRK